MKIFRCFFIHVQYVLWNNGINVYKVHSVLHWSEYYSIKMSVIENTQLYWCKGHIFLD